MLNFIYVNLARERFYEYSDEHSINFAIRDRSRWCCE